jgi:hypothetical protein
MSEFSRDALRKSPAVQDLVGLGVPFERLYRWILVTRLTIERDRNRPRKGRPRSVAQRLFRQRLEQLCEDHIDKGKRKPHGKGVVGKALPERAALEALVFDKQAPTEYTLRRFASRWKKTHR